MKMITRSNTVKTEKPVTKNKKKRVSKKNKSAWRKHTDVKDVEEFLEGQRQDERIGPISLKPDEELFIIDGDQKNVQSEKKNLSLKQKRKLNALKEPKNLIALKNTSNVDDPIVKRNHVKLKKNYRGNVELEVINPKTQRHIQANKDRAKYYEKLDSKIAKNKQRYNHVVTTDIWEEKVGIAKYPELHGNQWISRDLALHHLKNTGKIVKKLHESAHHATSKLKAFEKPHPGTSYNPSFQDHQNLLKKVIEKEQAIVKTEKHLKRVTDKMFSKLTPEELQNHLLKEKTVGLPEHGNENENEKNDESNKIDEDDEEPYISVNPPVENKKKDRKSRRKQKEQIVIKNELKNKKIEKKKITDILKIKKLREEVVETEEKVNQAIKRRKILNKKKKFEPKRLSKVKLVEPDIAINLPEDISGNLRNVKPEASLLIDRFMNFQKRNILPASVDVGTRKPTKIKRFVRSTHKTVPTQLLNIK